MKIGATKFAIAAAFLFGTTALAQETREICSDPQRTAELHKVKCAKEHGEPKAHTKCLGNGEWRWDARRFAFEAPQGFEFTGEQPTIKLVEDNHDSWNWNGLGYTPGSFDVVVDNPDRIAADVYASSHSMVIQVCAPARRIENK